MAKKIDNFNQQARAAEFPWPRKFPEPPLSEEDEIALKINDFNVRESHRADFFPQAPVEVLRAFRDFWSKTGSGRNEDYYRRVQADLTEVNHIIETFVGVDFADKSVISKAYSATILSYLAEVWLNDPIRGRQAGRTLYDEYFNAAPKMNLADEIEVQERKSYEAAILGDFGAILQFSHAEYEDFLTQNPEVLAQIHASDSGKKLPPDFWQNFAPPQLDAVELNELIEGQKINLESVYIFAARALQRLNSKGDNNSETAEQIFIAKSILTPLLESLQRSAFSNAIMRVADSFRYQFSGEESTENMGLKIVREILDEIGDTEVIKNKILTALSEIFGEAIVESDVETDARFRVLVGQGVANSVGGESAHDLLIKFREKTDTSTLAKILKKVEDRQAKNDEIYEYNLQNPENPKELLPEIKCSRDGILSNITDLVAETAILQDAENVEISRAESEKRILQNKVLHELLTEELAKKSPIQIGENPEEKQNLAEFLRELSNSEISDLLNILSPNNFSIGENGEILSTSAEDLNENAENNLAKTFAAAISRARKSKKINLTDIQISGNQIWVEKILAEMQNSGQISTEENADLKSQMAEISRFYAENPNENADTNSAGKFVKLNLAGAELEIELKRFTVAKLIYRDEDKIFGELQFATRFQRENNKFDHGTYKNGKLQQISDEDRKAYMEKIYAILRKWDERRKKFVGDDGLTEESQARGAQIVKLFARNSLSRFAGDSATKNVANSWIVSKN